MVHLIYITIKGLNANVVKRKLSEMPTKKSRCFTEHIKIQITDKHFKMLEGFTHLSEVPVLLIMHAVPLEKMCRRYCRVELQIR